MLRDINSDYQGKECALRIEDWMVQTLLCYKKVLNLSDLYEVVPNGTPLENV